MSRETTPREARSLEAALYDDAGRPIPITKIEIDLDHEQGAFVWTVHGPAGPLATAEGERDESPGMIRSTAVLVDAMLGALPDQAGAGLG